MTEQLKTLIIGLIGVVMTVANLLVSYFNPANATMIVGIVSAVATCATTIVNIVYDNTHKAQNKVEKK